VVKTITTEQADQKKVPPAAAPAPVSKEVPQ
jgi:hypothetical protein